MDSDDLKAPGFISRVEVSLLVLVFKILFLCLFRPLASNKLNILLLSLLAGVILTMTGASVVAA